ncbi:unnamed protein product [Arabidopsis halleri]
MSQRYCRIWFSSDRIEVVVVTEEACVDNGAGGEGSI